MTAWHFTIIFLSLCSVSHGARPLTVLVSDVGIGSQHIIWHLQQRGGADRFLTSTASSLLGNIAITTMEGTPDQDIGEAVGTAGSTKSIGSNVYGPFEAGFGTRQDNVIRRQFGCTTDVTHCYSDGGVDVATAEAICAYNCNIELPRIENGVYYGLLDSCGGHTQYHFHRNLNCLYTMAEGGTHSPRLAETVQARTGGGGGGGGNRPPRGLQEFTTQYVYGQWEDYATQTIPDLDACNGHWGYTPESPDVMTYHYHTTEGAPFTLACFGPNEDNSPVTVKECRSLYDGCSDTDPLEMMTFIDGGVVKTIPYQSWCPCFDRSGWGMAGSGLNVGNVESDRRWTVRGYNSQSLSWETLESGTFAERLDFPNGINTTDITSGVIVPSPSPEEPIPEEPSPEDESVPPDEETSTLNPPLENGSLFSGASAALSGSWLCMIVASAIVSIAS